MTRMSDIELVQNFTGFGLYDQVVVQKLRRLTIRTPTSGG